jgi:predicted transcriptional regulator
MTSMTHAVDEAAVGDSRLGDTSIDADRLSDALEDPHCRYLLTYLRDTSGPVSISEVATYVVAQITDSSPDEVPNDVLRRVQTWFYHGQLPMLDDHGVVEFDPDSRTVKLAEDSPV